MAVSGAALEHKPGFSVRLVYARSQPEASEPLIALCRTEAEARTIAREVAELGAGAEVRWETHEVSGDAGDEVYAVVLAPSISPDPRTESDPITVAVFAVEEVAEEDAARRRQRDGVAHYVVWPLLIGWRRSGWPFERSVSAS